MIEGRRKKILSPAERGRLGGKARLRTMTKAQRQAIARKASRAASKALSPKQRQEAARKAVLARWANVKGKKPSKTRKPVPQPLLPASRRTYHTA